MNRTFGWRVLLGVVKNPLDVQTTSLRKNQTHPMGRLFRS